MTDTLTLYSFGKTDRSAKVRWLANELGLPIDEVPVKFGEQRKAPYRQVNPFGVVPSAVFRDVHLKESGAICEYLCEQFPASGLRLRPDDPRFGDFLYWCYLANTHFESDIVNYTLSRMGIMDGNFAPLLKPGITARFDILVGLLPATGYLMGEQFTLADILMGYVVQLGVTSGVLPYPSVAPYLSLLMSRPAAQAAHVFDKVRVS